MEVLEAVDGAGFFAVRVDFGARVFVRDLAVLDFDADLVAVDFVVLREERVVVALRVDAAAFVVRFGVCFAVAALLLLVVVGLRDAVRRVVLAALDFVVGDFDDVDFFRVDDVVVVLDAGVLRLVVVAFLVAIFTLPAK